MTVGGMEGRRKRERLTSDRLSALAALLGKEFPEALGTVRLILTRCELLSGQNLVTVGASEALSVPRGRLVRDASLVDHLKHATLTQLCTIAPEVITNYSFLRSTINTAFFSSSGDCLRDIVTMS